MAGLPCVLSALVQHAAVVAGEDDEGVVAQLEFIERAHDLADHPVELLDEITVAAGLAAALELAPGREGMMDVRRGEVEEERLAPGARASMPSPFSVSVVPSSSSR